MVRKAGGWGVKLATQEADWSYFIHMQEGGRGGKGGRENKQEWEGNYKTSKFPLSDILPPASLHFLQVP